MNQNDQYLDLPKLSKRCCLSVSTLRGHIRSGSLKCYRIGGKLLVSWAEFTEWIKQHPVDSEADIDRMVSEIMEQR